MADSGWLACLGEIQSAFVRIMERFSEPIRLYEARMRLLRVSRQAEGLFGRELPPEQQRLAGVFKALILSVCRKFNSVLSDFNKRKVDLLFDLLELMESIMRERLNTLADDASLHINILDGLEEQYPELVEDVRKHYPLYPYEGFGVVTRGLLKLIEEIAGKESLRLSSLANSLKLDPEELREKLKKARVFVTPEGVVLRFDDAQRKIEEKISRGDIRVEDICQMLDISAPEAIELLQDIMLSKLDSILDELQKYKYPEKSQTAVRKPVKGFTTEKESGDESFKTRQEEPTKDEKRKTTPLRQPT